MSTSQNTMSTGQSNSAPRATSEENRARLIELRRILADDPHLDSVTDADAFRQELADLEAQEWTK